MCSTSSDGAKEEEESRSRKGRATPEDEKDAAAALRHGSRGCYDGGDDDDEDGEVDAGATDGNGELQANAHADTTIVI